jgi:nitrite reductase (NADH) large subunit
VVVHDSLGLGAELERAMQKLVDTYRCEWAEVVNDPDRRARFAHFANSAQPDTHVQFVTERGQRRPSDWQKTPAPTEAPPASARRKLPVVSRTWVPLVDVAAVPRDGGVAVRYGNSQLAIFNFASRGEWYATQNMCPHRKDMVLARGLVGDQSGRPKVACPQHKKTFSLETGECTSGEAYRVATFPVQINAGMVYVELPAADILEARLCQDDESCGSVEAAE